MEPKAVDNQINSLSIIETMEINSVSRVITKINQFQELIHSQLKPSVDYGIIPGTKKPTLLKPGAEKILMLFGVTSEYEIIEKIQDYDKGFFAFSVRCILSKNGQIVTEGLGHCNSMEKKYVSGNVDSYTIANTCLKMAKKRSQVDATLTIASLSEVFTQDVEDMDIGGGNREPAKDYSSNEASNVKMTFGKYRDKTLGQILATDKKYIEWLADKAEKEDLKNAAKALLENGTSSNNGRIDTPIDHHQEEHVSGPDNTEDVKLPF